ncbi:hypothetical protein V8C86DRAFT_2509081, partial [Haematococcus lacustris]
MLPPAARCPAPPLGRCAPTAPVARDDGGSWAASSALSQSPSLRPMRKPWLVLQNRCLAAIRARQSRRAAPDTGTPSFPPGPLPEPGGPPPPLLGPLPGVLSRPASSTSSHSTSPSPSTEQEAEEGRGGEERVSCAPRVPTALGSMTASSLAARAADAAAATVFARDAVTLRPATKVLTAWRLVVVGAVKLGSASRGAGAGAEAGAPAGSHSMSLPSPSDLNNSASSSTSAGKEVSAMRSTSRPTGAGDGELSRPACPSSLPPAPSTTSGEP